MNKSESIGQLAEALSKAQSTIQNAEKAAQNPAFKRATGQASKYADLTAIWDACREALTANKLAVVQTVATEGQVVKVTTLLAHSSGEWVSGEMSATAAGADAQKIGSATTYLRRYSLAAMVGVAPENEDDDGNKASGHDVEAGRTAKTAPQAAAQIDLAKRKRDALAWMDQAFGAEMRKRLASVLGRTFPDGSDIKFQSAEELEKVESWIVLAKAANGKEQRQHSEA